MTKKEIKKRGPKFIERESKLEDLVSSAFGDLQSLGEEMREAFDNTPESLQNDGVGAARGEAADNLENLSEPECPEELQGERFIVKYQERQLSPSAQRKLSRSGRCSSACDDLRHAIEYLENIEDDKTYTKEEREAASEFKGEIENLIDEAEAVEFPGMYG